MTKYAWDTLIYGSTDHLFTAKEVLIHVNPIINALKWVQLDINNI